LRLVVCVPFSALTLDTVGLMTGYLEHGCRYVGSKMEVVDPLTTVLNFAEKYRRRRLCNAGNSTGSIADIAWCSHDCLSYGFATT